MMAHFIFYEKETGRQLAEDPKMPKTIPGNVVAVDVGTAPDWRTSRWNPATLEVEPIPAPILSATALEFLRLRRDGVVTDADLKSAVGLLLKALPSRTFE